MPATYKVPAPGTALTQDRSHKKKGTKFHLLSYYKYPVGYFQNQAIKGGLKPIDYFIDENQPMVIHVLGVS